jgi:hypothetical protein
VEAKKYECTSDGIKITVRYARVDPVTNKNTFEEIAEIFPVGKEIAGLIKKLSSKAVDAVLTAIKNAQVASQPQGSRVITSPPPIMLQLTFKEDSSVDVTRVTPAVVDQLRKEIGIIGSSPEEREVIRKKSELALNKLYAQQLQAQGKAGKLGPVDAKINQLEKEFTKATQTLRMTLQKRLAAAKLKLADVQQTKNQEEIAAVGKEIADIQKSFKLVQPEVRASAAQVKKAPQPAEKAKIEVSAPPENQPQVPEAPAKKDEAVSAELIPDAPPAPNDLPTPPQVGFMPKIRGKDRSQPQVPVKDTQGDVMQELKVRFKKMGLEPEPPVQQGAEALPPAAPANVVPHPAEQVEVRANEPPVQQAQAMEEALPGGIPAAPVDVPELPQSASRPPEDFRRKMPHGVKPKALQPDMQEVLRQQLAAALKLRQKALEEPVEHGLKAPVGNPPIGVPQNVQRVKPQAAAKPKPAASNAPVTQARRPSVPAQVRVSQNIASKPKPGVVSSKAKTVVPDDGKANLFAQIREGKKLKKVDKKDERAKQAQSESDIENILNTLQQRMPPKVQQFEPVEDVEYWDDASKNPAVGPKKNPTKKDSAPPQANSENVPPNKK